MSTLRRAAAVIAITMLWSGHCFAQISITLNLVPVPGDQLAALKLSDGPFSERTVATDLPPTGRVSTDVGLSRGDPAVSVAVAVWKDSSETGFPVVLAPAFAGYTVDIHLRKREIGNLPDIQQLRGDCDARPNNISSAFNILYRCKSHALALEAAGDKWDKPHRQALQGWLVANYYLATLSQPVSPYGVDPDLISRLEEIVAEEDRWRRGERAWLPLQTSYARQFVELPKSLPIRLAGFVPQLIRDGRIEEAQRTNAAALSQIRQFEGPIVGLTEGVLRDNATYIESLARGH